MVEINKTITLKLIFLISIIALSSAFFIEYVLGHQPCNLCILERIPYLLALIIIVLNYKFINLEKYFILFLILIFLAATILSLYHLGIEQGFIEESLVCDLKNGSNLLSKEDILRQLQEKNVSCKDVSALSERIIASANLAGTSDPRESREKKRGPNHTK